MSFAKKESREEANEGSKEQDVTKAGRGLSKKAGRKTDGQRWSMKGLP